MEKAKLFNGVFGDKVVKVKFELEFDVNKKLTVDQVKNMIDNMGRTELGEIVLNFLDKSEVIVDDENQDFYLSNTKYCPECKRVVDNIHTDEDDCWWECFCGAFGDNSGNDEYDTLLNEI